MHCPCLLFVSRRVIVGQLQVDHGLLGLHRGIREWVARRRTLWGRDAVICGRRCRGRKMGSLIYLLLMRISELVFMLLYGEYFDEPPAFVQSFPALFLPVPLLATVGTGICRNALSILIWYETPVVRVSRGDAGTLGCPRED